jgi:hypothetical protein
MDISRVASDLRRSLCKTADQGGVGRASKRQHGCWAPTPAHSRRCDQSSTMRIKSLRRAAREPGETQMRNSVGRALLAGAFLAVLSGSVWGASTASCENKLQEVKAAQKRSKINEAQSREVTSLVLQGLERCAAADDIRADLFFSEALRVIAEWAER